MHLATQSDRMQVLRDFARAAGGALVFALPMLMTMELWWLGSYLDSPRMLILLLTTIPLLVILSRHVGFEKTRAWRDDLLDAAIALGISAIVCSGLLILFGTISSRTSWDEALGRISIQMVPGAIGALLARSQFGTDSGDDSVADEEETYGGELFLMTVGSLFLGLNVAPTEEIALISFQMTSWHVLCLVAVSIVLMHCFVFAVGFAGGSEVASDERWWNPLLRFTLPGYVIALSVSLYLLWIFGRLDGLGVENIIFSIVVLGFPAAIGAAAARLVL